MGLGNQAEIARNIGLFNSADFPAISDGLGGARLGLTLARVWAGLETAT